MDNNKKIIELQSKRTPKIGYFIFGLIFVYIIVNIILFYNKEHLSLYEVQADDIAADFSYEGVAVRQEHLVYSNDSGYINSFVSSGDKVSKGMIVYAVSGSRSVFDGSGLSDEITLTDNEISKIKRDIADFKDDFSLNNLLHAQDFRSDLISEYNDFALETISEKMSQNASMIEGCNLYSTQTPGIVSFLSDSLVGVAQEDIDSETFEKYTYSVRNLRSGDFSAEGTPVYRLVTSESWNIVLKIDEDFYVSNLETEKVKVRIEKDGFTFNAPVSFEKRSDSYFAILSLENYLVRYIDDRFLTVSIIGDREEGLKIPLTSITTKEFFTIPNDYIVYDKETNSHYVYVFTYDDDGNELREKNELTIYFNDGTESYIDGKYIKAGVYIDSPDKGERFRITKIERLEGVFNVNRGYAIFRRIERLRENEEYCIIKMDTEFGLNLYDHIALVADTAKESQLIY